MLNTNFDAMYCFLEKLIFVKLVKKFSAFYGTRIFINVSTIIR